MADLDGAQAGPAVDPAVDDQGPADPAADGQVEQGRAADPRPEAGFRQSGRVGVVLDATRREFPDAR